jgi:hypothetical protein
MKSEIKFFQSLVFICSLLFASMCFAGSAGLVFQKYSDPTEIPSELIMMRPDKAMIEKSFLDEQGRSRKDKWYYLISSTFKSKLMMKDLEYYLNPKNGRLDEVFEKTVVVPAGKDIYTVNMEVNTLLRRLDFSSTMEFSSVEINERRIFHYKFFNFNSVFTDMDIRVELEKEGGHCRVNIYQVSAVKASSYLKLKRFGALGIFESEIKQKINKAKTRLFSF